MLVAGKVRLSKRFIFFNLFYALRVELVAGKRELVGMTVFFAGVLILVEWDGGIESSIYILGK